MGPLGTRPRPLEHMRPIPYKAEGSRYGACGIRIDGTLETTLAESDRLVAALKQRYPAQEG